MLIVKMLLGLAFLGSFAWFISAPSFESAVATVSSLGAFIGAWIGDKRLKQKGRQNQVVENGSVGIQAGGNVNVGKIENQGSSKDVKQKSEPKRW